MNAIYDRDNRGIWCVRENAIPFQLARLFEEDVQGSEYYCRRLSKEVTRAESDSSHHFSGSGNAFSISINRDGMLIRSLWDETMPELLLPLQDARAYVEEWLAAIEADKQQRNSLAKE